MVVDEAETGGRASAFAYRDFRLVWSGQVLSSVGNWLLVLAVPYYVFALTGSPLATGAAFIAEVLPALVLGPIAGVFVDRWERHRVMIAVDVVRAGCVLALVFVQDRDLLWLLYLAVFLENAAGQFYRPARQAMLPAIIGRGRALVSANSMNSLGDGVVRFVGGSLGGVLYAFIGFTGVVLVDAATYAVSAALIVALRVCSRGGESRTSGLCPGVGLGHGPSSRQRGVQHDLRPGQGLGNRTALLGLFGQPLKVRLRNARHPAAGDHGVDEAQQGAEAVVLRPVVDDQQRRLALEVHLRRGPQTDIERRVQDVAGEAERHVATGHGTAVQPSRRPIAGHLHDRLVTERPRGAARVVRIQQQLAPAVVELDLELVLETIHIRPVESRLPQLLLTAVRRDGAHRGADARTRQALTQSHTPDVIRGETQPEEDAGCVDYRTNRRHRHVGGSVDGVGDHR